MTTQTSNYPAIVIGDFSGYDHNGSMSWECPFTGVILDCSGEFAWDDEGYFHDVTDEDGNHLYTVIAK